MSTRPGPRSHAEQSHWRGIGAQNTASGRFHRCTVSYEKLDGREVAERSYEQLCLDLQKVVVHAEKSLMIDFSHLKW